MNGSWRRNKQKAFTFVSPKARHYFCIISIHEAERVEARLNDFIRAGIRIGRPACRQAGFLCFVSLAGQRNESNKNIIGNHSASK
jgi:hypothetical protein